MSTQLDLFNQAIEIQQESDNQSYKEIMNLQIKERVDKGEAIANVSVVFQFFDFTPDLCRDLPDGQKYIKKATILCDNNISKFREGTPVRLSNGTHSFPMDIVEDSVDSFILAPNSFQISYCHIDAFSYNKHNWEINAAKLDVTGKMLAAVSKILEDDPAKNNFINSLLNGNLRNRIIEGLSFNSLNNSQNSAVIKAHGSEYFHLIQGPPGTGKTLTISHLAKVLANQGKTVFITGPTHTAINNCLSTLSSLPGLNFPIIKIGNKYSLEGIKDNEKIEKLDRFTYENYLIKVGIDSGIIIGGTTYNLCYPASKKMNNWKFDVAIIDEASQLSIPLSFPVLAHCKKIIFVGDHKQLDPIVPSSTNPLFSSSIFKKLADLYPDNLTLLEISYRLNEELIRIPNTLFYHNRLRSAVDKQSYKNHLHCKYHPEILNHPDPKLLVLHNEFDAKGRSPFESKLVTEIVSDLLDNDTELKDIAIITPYRAQVREIKKVFAKNINLKNKIDSKILFIDTVDRMQGQERKFIIYTLSNSHPLDSSRNIGFFYSPNRLNVAITRATTKCIVISNYKVFDLDDLHLFSLEDYTNLKDKFDVFKKYYDLTTKIELFTNQNDDW